MSYLIARRTCRYLLFAVVVLAGACTTQIYSPAATNPPPSAPFQTFGRVQLQPVVLNPAFADHGYNQSATEAIERNLQASLAPQLQSWDKGSGPTLVIEPYIEEIKFVGGAARFWAGAFAGSSAVVMRVTYKDADTGETVASPVFYQHASAMGGAWTIGRVRQRHAEARRGADRPVHAGQLRGCSRRPDRRSGRPRARRKLNSTSAGRDGEFLGSRPATWRVEVAGGRKADRSGSR